MLVRSVLAYVCQCEVERSPGSIRTLPALSAFCGKMEVVIGVRFHVPTTWLQDSPYIQLTSILEVHLTFNRNPITRPTPCLDMIILLRVPPSHSLDKQLASSSTESLSPHHVGTLSFAAIAEHTSSVSQYPLHFHLSSLFTPP